MRATQLPNACPMTTRPLLSCGAASSRCCPRVSRVASARLSLTPMPKGSGVRTVWPSIRSLAARTEKSSGPRPSEGARSRDRPCFVAVVTLDTVLFFRNASRFDNVAKVREINRETICECAWVQEVGIHANRTQPLNESRIAIKTADFNAQHLDDVGRCVLGSKETGPTGTAQLGETFLDHGGDIRQSGNARIAEDGKAAQGATFRLRNYHGVDHHLHSARKQSIQRWTGPTIGDVLDINACCRLEDFRQDLRG